MLLSPEKAPWNIGDGLVGFGDSWHLPSAWYVCYSELLPLCLVGQHGSQ